MNAHSAKNCIISLYALDLDVIITDVEATKNTIRVPILETVHPDSTATAQVLASHTKEREIPALRMKNVEE